MLSHIFKYSVSEKSACFLTCVVQCNVFLFCFFNLLQGQSEFKSETLPSGNICNFVFATLVTWAALLVKSKFDLVGDRKKEKENAAFLWSDNRSAVASPQVIQVSADFFSKQTGITVFFQYGGSRPNYPTLEVKPLSLWRRAMAKRKDSGA